MHELYADGGVIGRNPSTAGGTWAARLIAGDLVIAEKSGVITPAEARMPEVTNNLTEMLALVRGLSLLPDDWTGVVYSDSQITLGRIFLGWKWSQIPPWLHGEFQRQRARLKRWDQITHCLVDGHPTRAELAAGIGRRGHKVSSHNVWCDSACQAEAARFREACRG